MQSKRFGHRVKDHSDEKEELTKIEKYDVEMCFQMTWKRKICTTKKHRYARRESPAREVSHRSNNKALLPPGTKKQLEF